MPEHDDERHHPGSVRGPLIALALLAALWLAAYAAYRPGPPRGTEGRATDFSALRALADLRELLHESAPHPMGSAANTLVRERIIARLRQLGYEPELQSADFGCDPYAVCGTPLNIVARIDGGAPPGSSAVLLAAHYD